MSWVKLDDGFGDHPKIARVGPIGASLQVQALCYANKNLTDGFVPSVVAHSFVTRATVWDDEQGQRWTCGPHDVDWPAVLVKAGVWELVPGGYYIHDYPDYQPTKAEVLAERAARARYRQFPWLFPSRSRA